MAPKANALCGSERGQYFEGSNVTPGHEAAGIVAAAGEDTKTEVGAHGVIFLMDFCGSCRNCAEGLTNQCLAKKADYGFNSDGGYGPYALISESVFFPVDSSIPLSEATLLLDIMGTGGHSIRRAQLLRRDFGSLLISGAGPIGLGVLAMAKLMLGREFPVLISDVIPYRLNLAEKLGGVPVDPGGCLSASNTVRSFILMSRETSSARRGRCWEASTFATGTLQAIWSFCGIIYRILRRSLPTVSTYRR